MRNFRYFYLLLIGLVLSGALPASASDTNMDTMMDKKQDTMMDQKPSGIMDGKKSGMRETKMEDSMTGMLMGVDGHHASGKAMLSNDMAGKAMLTLSNIKVDRVPDGQVYLAKDGDFAHGVHVGMLKQFSGSVSFALPPGTDAGMYNSVVIWCKKFNVEIGRAELAKAMMK